MLIAMRTAPAQSWTNPAERIMSILNLGLQGVALLRDQMSSEMEDLFSKKNTLEEIRAAAAKNLNLKNRLHNCILNIQQSLLCSQTERLKLHENPFQCYNPADDQNIDDFFKVLKLIFLKYEFRILIYLIKFLNRLFLKLINH